MTARIGVLALARPTFDVPFAEATAARAMASLRAAGLETVGDGRLLFDEAATMAGLAALSGEALDLLLVLQVTFTDATMIVRLAEADLAPLAIWAFPEPRAGVRLRLNGFCGLNLAMHALGRAGRRAAWLYAAADAPEAGADILAIARGGQGPAAPPLPAGPAPDIDAIATADAALAALRGSRIGRVGEPPAGFDTCRYDPEALQGLLGMAVEPIALGDVFARARALPQDEVSTTRAAIARRVSGLDGVDADQLDRSLRVYRSLEGLARDGDLKGLAVRCWPEMFTEYGCAACGPMGLMTEARVPCACEADVYGVATSMLLQEVAGAPAWLVDVVDMDPASDSGVFWHCGCAPPSMAAPATPPRAQIHSNRRMPLLAEFTLAAGRITVARLSQARNDPKLVLAGAEILDAPMSFTGTSAVVRFDREAGAVAAALLEQGLEHHVAIAYGEHRPALRAAASRLALPVVELA